MSKNYEVFFEVWGNEGLVIPKAVTCGCWEGEDEAVLKAIARENQMAVKEKVTVISNGKAHYDLTLCDETGEHTIHFRIGEKTHG